MSGSMSLQKIRAESLARDVEERRRVEQRRTALVLIMRHLVDHGYTSTYERLCSECQPLSLQEVDVADNITLQDVIAEFETYYQVKFGRKPKLTRRGDGGGGGAVVPAARNGVASAGAGAPAQPSQYVSGAARAKERREKGLAHQVQQANGARKRSARSGSGGVAPSAAAHAGDKPPIRRRDSGGQAHPNGAADGDASLGISIQGMATGQGDAPSAGSETAVPGPGGNGEDAGFYEHLLLKPMPDFGSAELAELAMAITRDIYVRSPNVTWDAISGLGKAKQLLKEAVVFPHKFPHLFKGILSPWRGIMLYGPPGTGKTMLAKAVATECRTTFFNISASSIISKWRGDSEKLVRVLFQLARYHAPSTIFFDEIDALMMARGGEGEHEASRRMKTELLMQMDGLATTQSEGDKFVFVLGATNLPWELDSAMLRRLEKRIYVGLPEHEAREEIIANALRDFDVEVPASDIAAMTNNYSGSDLYQLCKECAMRPLRKLLDRYYKEGCDEEIAAKMSPIQRDDVELALRSCKSTGHGSKERYDAFTHEFGS